MNSANDEVSSPDSGQALPPGAVVEEFTIGRVLGSGGFGITYLAEDSRLGRPVVVKENLPVQFCWRDPSSMTVRPRHTEGGDAESFVWSLENFEKEAAMLASLDHPGIVRVLRSFEAFGTAFFVMPFVEGTALDEQIRGRQEQGNPFSEEELLGVLWRMLEALEYLHARGIYHRDIKPGNILITEGGVPVLIDFGSARQRLSERSLTVIESPGYTPFEQLQSRGRIGPWSDLYAMAGTLCKAITGEAPPKATDRIMEDSFEPLGGRASLKGAYSARFLESIDRAMAPRPEDRYQDAAGWRDAIWGEPRGESEKVSSDVGAIPAVQEKPGSQSNGRVETRTSIPAEIIGAANWPQPPRKDGCPLCGRSGIEWKKAKTLYGQRVCKKCVNSLTTRRQGAYLIDLIAFWLISTVLWAVILSEQEPNEEAVIFLSYILMPVIFSFKDGFSGYSLGKRICGVRVIVGNKGTPAGFLDSFVRNVPLLIPLMPLFVATELCKGKRIGDGWANTKVVWEKYKDNS